MILEIGGFIAFIITIVGFYYVFLRDGRKK